MSASPKKDAARGTKTAAAHMKTSTSTVPLREEACHCATQHPCSTCLRWIEIATRLVIRRAAWGAT